MDMVTCAGSFLLGGVSAIILMGLLLLFIENPLKNTKEESALKNRPRLAALDRVQERRGVAKSGDSEAMRALKSQHSEDRISPSPNAVAGRWGKVYTPFPEPL